MKRNVVITVRGLQPEVDADEPIEVISAGTYMRKENTHYLSYEEADEDGNITNNRIKITDRSVEMVKKGAVTTQMIFLLGEKQYACYATPFGDLTLGITTKKISVKEDSESLTTNLRYGLEINGEHVSDCQLDVEVKVCGQI